MEKFVYMTDCHVKKFLHRRNVNKIYHIEKVLHMINVEQNVLCGEICHVEKCIKLFCCKICFVTIYDVLSRNLFRRAFCVQKNLTKNFAFGEKRQILPQAKSFVAL